MNCFLTNLLDHERLCSICGKSYLWDCQSDKCRACRDMIQGIKNEKYKPVFRGVEREEDISNKK